MKAFVFFLSMPLVAAAIFGTCALASLFDNLEHFGNTFVDWFEDACTDCYDQRSLDFAMGAAIVTWIAIVVVIVNLAWTAVSVG